MFSVMTWNLENLERPATNAEQAVKDRYARKLQHISELITRRWAGSGQSAGGPRHSQGSRATGV
jgi:hypothetical protein